jgi:hypothetical protein
MSDEFKPAPKPIRRSVISETTRNIDNIANAIDEGRPADKDLMVKLINRMLAFLDAVIKPSDRESEEEDDDSTD